MVSSSDKIKFWIKPNLLQLHSSYMLLCFNQPKRKKEKSRKSQVNVYFSLTENYQMLQKVDMRKWLKMVLIILREELEVVGENHNE